MPYSLEKDIALRKRAQTALPNGMYGHMSTSLFPENYPQFVAKAEGGRIWGEDGYEYIDFMCAYGPNILGYQHPKVEEAVRKQMKLGDCTTGPSSAMVELAEKFIEKGAHADWAMFCKNGSDATTLCLMIARAQTGKNTVLMAEGTYHGNDPWCSISGVGVPESARDNIITFSYNDSESLLQAVAQAGDDLAAIIVTPNLHEVFVPQQIVDPDFAKAVRQLCDNKGAALILDDVRCSYRFSLGCTWDTIGVKPDLCAMGKTLANGYPLSAVTGSNAFRDGASHCFATGSYWFSSVAFAAGLATLQAIEEEDAINRMAATGSKFRQGLADQAEAYGIDFLQSGPVQMPLFMLSNDPDFEKIGFFCNEAVKHGVYLHPVHNMFICAEHESDIDRALLGTEKAFKQLKSMYGESL